MALQSRTIAFLVSLFAFMSLFVAVAHAQAAPPIDVANLTPSSIAALLVWAVEHKAWRFLIAGLLVGTAWLVRKLQTVPLFSGMWLFKWFKTDRGGSFLVLFLSEAAAISTALMLPTFNWFVLIDGAIAAVTAVGGYTVIKKILRPSDKKVVVEPVVPEPVPAPTPEAGFITVTLGIILAFVGVLFTVLAVTGCDLSEAKAKDTAATIGIAHFATVEAALTVFQDQYPRELAAIQSSAISECMNQMLPAEYKACTDAYIDPRVKPYLDVVEALKIYDALHKAGVTASDEQLVVAFAHLLKALDLVKLHVGRPALGAAGGGAL